VVLGLTTSIRIVAPFAGVLVAVYWIGRSGRRAVPGLVVYGVVAIVTTYLTWPVLWGNPLLSLSERVSGVSDFGGFPVHLWGVKYGSGDLPWQYLPTLLAVQLTLPAVLLFVVGLPYSWIQSKPDGGRRLLVVLVWAWLVLPVLAVILRWVPIYNNFRHVLFMVPPMFLIMGFGAWKASDMVRSPAIRGGLAVVALLPGLVGIVRLHPYEYIYYNQLVGGVRGAEGKFDLDYWCISLREGTAFVNREAPPGTRVGVASGYLDLIAPFAGKNLLLVRGDDEGLTLDYSLACHRGIGQPSAFFPNMETVYEVRADGALLAVVKHRVEAP
jgi:hypothetical protein